jgi:alkyl hydroperoxide reductase subunit AhpF
MRGNESSFIRLGDKPQTFVIVPDTERPYAAHYVDVDGKKQKKNCHASASCPYCQNGMKLFKGIYAIGLAKGGVLGFIDFKPGLIRQLTVLAKKDGLTLSAFISKRLLTISREIKDNYTEYHIESVKLSDEDHDALMRSIYEGKNSDVMMKLLEKLESLVAPGSTDEDS